MDITDGEWYLLAQFKNDFGWGEIGKKKILVDVTLPEEFEVSLMDGGEDGVPSLVFQTDDALSGMDRYEIDVGGKPAATVRAGDLVNGMYPVPPQDGGAQVVKIKAFDKAGNVREASATLNLPFVAKPSAKGAEEQATGSATPLWMILLLVGLGIAVGALGGWNVYTRKNVQKAQALFLLEIAAIREKNDKVFAAMREEFEQMVDALDEQPQLTPKERDFLEQVKEVLEISEEVLDTALEDLKKMARGQQ
jgi:hypothetical protein